MTSSDDLGAKRTAFGEPGLEAVVMEAAVGWTSTMTGVTRGLREEGIVMYLDFTGDGL